MNSGELYTGSFTLGASFTLLVSVLRTMGARLRSLTMLWITRTFHFRLTLTRGQVHAFINEGWTMTTQDQCDAAIHDYRTTHRSDWLLICWAIAGGAIGSAIIILSANVQLVAILLGD